VYLSVQSAWWPFTTQLEGHLTFMYLDILGYVTTGCGNLVDPLESALSLPWVNADGSPANAADITTAWHAVDCQRSDPKGKRQTSGLATKYGGAFAGVTTIRLTEDGVTAVVLRQVAANEATLRKYFPGYDTMPADAQMCINSMAWAMGAGFPATFKAFTAAVNAGDWGAAKANADFRGVGVANRIAANKVMLGNAGEAALRGVDPGELFYPSDLTKEAPTVPLPFHVADTEPPPPPDDEPA
jgi:GH24 family phage-related lysozyme (muramidase)